MSGLTETDPVKFADAIKSPNILAGDTLLLRRGTYAGNWTLNIGGTQAAPVIIKSYPGESVVIDGGLKFAKPYVKVYDLEITDSAPDDHTDHKNLDMSQPGCWLIGCEIHHLKSDGVNWFGSGEGGIAECWIYGNGYVDTLGEWVCHAIYTHNHAGGARLIARNLLGEQIGRYTIHIYSGGDNYLRDYTCEDNVIFGDPVHTGGGLGLKDFIYQRNIQFGDYCQHGRYTKDAGWNENGQIVDNLFYGMYGYSVNADSLNPWVNLTESRNTVWRNELRGWCEPSNRAGYTVEPTPASWSKLIPFTLSERWAGIQCTLTDGVFSAAMVNK